MIDTKELGAGSYPDALEIEYKYYKMKVITSNEIECIVYAKNEDDAKKLVLNGKWDDIENEKIKVEEILNVEEVEN